MKKWEDPKYLKREYVEKERSTSSIAKENGTYPMTIRRALKKYGFAIRNKSIAQKNNLKHNGSPMQGRKRSKLEREKISLGQQKRWEKLSENERQNIKVEKAELAKEQWNNLDDDEKQKRIRKMHGARRKTKGSKNENMVAEMLIDLGFKVYQRSRQYAPGRRFEIDITLPNDMIAIEWDGPTHFKPIQGELNFAKVQQRDASKNNNLLASGWTVVRCRDHSSSPTPAFCRRAVNQIIDVIEHGEKNKLHIIEAE